MLDALSLFFSGVALVIVVGGALVDFLAELKAASARSKPSGYKRRKVV